MGNLNDPIPPCDNGEEHHWRVFDDFDIVPLVTEGKETNTNGVPIEEVRTLLAQEPTTRYGDCLHCGLVLEVDYDDMTRDEGEWRSV